MMIQGHNQGQISISMSNICNKVVVKITFNVAKMTFYVPMITFVCGKDVNKITFCVAKFSLCGQMTYFVTTITFYVV